MLRPSDPRIHYSGPVRAVIFDWAGTTVDYGSLAPVNALVQLFARHGVTVSVKEARLPMGKHKREHIRQILGSDNIAAAWASIQGKPHSNEDVDKLYREFVPLQVEVISQYAELIPGTADTIRWLRSRGVKIGSTTGYTREMMGNLLEAAAQQGYRPDCIVCADDVPAGRPSPWMALQAAMKLETYPMQACIKVGDTGADIEEGLNAGMWTVAMVRSGNELGLSQMDAESLPPNELAARISQASNRLLQAGAHYTADDISELPLIVEAVDGRLSRGEKP